MPQLIEHIDAIAHERGVLFLRFGDPLDQEGVIDRLPSYWDCHNILRAVRSLSSIFVIHPLPTLGKQRT